MKLVMVVVVMIAMMKVTPDQSWMRFVRTVSVDNDAVAKGAVANGTDHQRAVLVVSQWIVHRLLPWKRQTICYPEPGKMERWRRRGG